eukprot:Hpha_TRINITY_DN18076_c0_g1::TRINITY_DN18076_c0_g1_i1::g.1224::m.1224
MPAPGSSPPTAPGSAPRRAYTFDGGRHTAMPRPVDVRKRPSAAAAAAAREYTTEWRTRSDASAARMQAITQKCADRRNQGKLLRHRHRCQEEVMVALKERKQVEKELGAALASLGKGGLDLSFSAEVEMIRQESRALELERRTAGMTLFSAVSTARRGASEARPGFQKETAIRQIRQLLSVCNDELRSLSEQFTSESQDKGQVTPVQAAGELKGLGMRLVRDAEEGAAGLYFIDRALLELF